GWVERNAKPKKRTITRSMGSRYAQPILEREPLVQGVGPPAGHIAKHPIAAALEALIGGAQIEHQRDAAAAAPELAGVVGGDRMESDHPGMETVRAVRIVLEHVGDKMGKTARHGLGGSSPHQRGGQQKLATIARQHREATNLCHAMML